MDSFSLFKFFGWKHILDGIENSDQNLKKI